MGGRLAIGALALAVDQGVEVDLRPAGHLAAQAQVGVFGDELDACLELAQRGGDADLVVAQARDDAHARHHDAPVAVGAVHQNSSGLRNSPRSEEHTSELQSLMRISYAVFCLQKKKTQTERD